MTESLFMGHKPRNKERFIDFSRISNNKLKNEVKYYFIFNSKENLLTSKYINILSTTLKQFSAFLNKYYIETKSFNNIENTSFVFKFRNYLLENGFKLLDNNKISSTEMNSIPYVLDFIQNFYDDREETEKDIWYSKNIKGAKIPASGVNGHINFKSIPIYYRDVVKRYFKTIITKKSWNHCHQIISHLNYFSPYSMVKDIRMDL